MICGIYSLTFIQVVIVGALMERENSAITEAGISSLHEQRRLNG